MAMEEIRERAKELCAQMTLQEKAGFLAGEDFWHTKALARLEVEPIRMADGPHGLRKQETGPDGAAIAVWNDLARVECVARVTDKVPAGTAVAEGVYSPSAAPGSLTLNALMGEALTDAGQAATLCANTVDAAPL